MVFARESGALSCANAPITNTRNTTETNNAIDRFTLTSKNYSSNETGEYSLIIKREGHEIAINPALKTVLPSQVPSGTAPGTTGRRVAPTASISSPDTKR